jgi:hypothetical protein
MFVDRCDCRNDRRTAAALLALCVTRERCCSSQRNTQRGTLAGCVRNVFPHELSHLVTELDPAKYLLLLGLSRGVSRNRAIKFARGMVDLLSVGFLIAIGLLVVACIGC